jgi:phosphatidate cytidylyltransferase
MVVVVVGAFRCGYAVVKVFVYLTAFGMLYEWIAMVEGRYLAWVARQVWEFVGIVYIAIPAISSAIILGMPNGLGIFCWLVGLVAGADIGGYVFGKIIGGWQLAPKISPNKTWSGLLGAMLIAALASKCIAELFSFKGGTGSWLLLGGAVAVIAQLGDLLESKIKRYFGIKDSSSLIPGHGGILDRTDGFVLTAPLLLLAISSFSQLKSYFI